MAPSPKSPKSPKRRARRSHVADRHAPAAETPAEPPVPRPLDEATSAAVLGELLVLGEVNEQEIAAVMDGRRGLTPREIAVAFRMSDTLQVPDPFALAPRFAEAFAALRARMKAPEQAPAPQPQPLVERALALFDELIDPANRWAADAYSIDATMDLAIRHVQVGDPVAARGVIAFILGGATEQEQLAAVAELEDDRASMLARE